MKNAAVAKIFYSPQSIHDLDDIGNYISETFKSPMSALNTVSEIQDSIDKLADFPRIGALLSFAASIGSDYRFLVCGNYLAFYRVQDDDVVYIDRILYGRRDYIAILLSNLPHSDVE